MKFLGWAALLMGATAISAQAQIPAGTVLVGGSAGYSRTSVQAYPIIANASGPESKSRNVSFRPQVGYFISDNLALGIDGHLSADKHQTTGQDTRRYLEYSVGPFVRYYKMLGESQFGLVGTLGAGYRENWDKYKWYDPRANYHGRGGYAEFTPGVVYFPVPKVGIEASFGNIGYSYFRNKQEQPTNAQVERQQYTSKSFGANLGLRSFALGASLYLGR
ncbi:outer membrane beta-barrel protein [Hymenobacter latericus]|uniref:outer membrane beta-barrel protein n=1 Tax=Hymenobacter sp. YIM 151858-1 TaxID=2987688 RepID=UPI0022280002|nr:outer membrane beta-barrel protein [Hymenobacter sp. YIM 151858-1]UYZ58458.1 outer membrane beta-barrel protein [Hymenobacter sp. YIM 151858-1]